MRSQRWVIVAQLSGDTFTPEVYGTWATKEAADQQLERWERRIERTYGGDPGTGIVMSVQQVRGKTAAQFERDFLNVLGMELAR